MSPAGGGEGEQGEEQEGGESNLLVGSDRVGSGRRLRRHGAAAPAEVARGGGGAPAKEWGRGGVGELRVRAWKPVGWSNRENGGRRRGSRGDQSPAAVAALLRRAPATGAGGEEAGEDQ